MTDGRGAVGARASDPEATEDYSKGIAVTGPLAAGVLGLAGLGAVLLVAADLSTVVRVTVGSTVRYAQAGHDRHAWALAVLGVVALPLTYAAAWHAVRVACTALAIVGAVALIVVLVNDLPDLGDTGIYGARFEDASASAGPGFLLSLLGGAALVAAGALGLLGGLGARSPRPPLAAE